MTDSRIDKASGAEKIQNGPTQALNDQEIENGLIQFFLGRITNDLTAIYTHMDLEQQDQAAEKKSQAVAHARALQAAVQDALEDPPINTRFFAQKQKTPDEESRIVYMSHPQLDKATGIQVDKIAQKLQEIPAARIKAALKRELDLGQMMHNYNNVTQAVINFDQTGPRGTNFTKMAKKSLTTKRAN